ncbi:class I SAM-dependent methyltransferase [Beduini massiliensis]|uniref:class I SAM-dependent methyltransferase n=1 Tax=Beduini massiliensis TaxID=1585974 RepID=UPI00059A93D2|nr:class I SAM-dependent methyltransferase [Beduini massiliensis]
MKEFIQFEKKPKLYQTSTKKFWDDPYISKGMLKAHLNPEVDAATRKEKFVEESVQWIRKQIPPATYPTLLDLGCGPGIYAELLSRNGYQVTGFDLSKRSIDYAKASAKEKKLDILYVEGNYVSDDFGRDYDLITMIYCDFGVLSNENRKILLKKVYQGLKSGGCFLFDVFTLEKYRGQEEYKEWSIEAQGFWREEASLILKSFYRYEAENTFLEQYIIINENETVCYNIWEHVFTLEEIKQDLKEAGFNKIEVYGDVTGKPYIDNGQTICLIAKK